MSAGPLDGVRILDFTQYMQGPWATQFLGDMGADVIKVEPPHGDWERSYTFDDVWLNGQSVLFLAMNRNKRSIVLNLKKAAGLEAALRMAAQVDVITENARPGVMERLGLGYEQIKEINPGIVYASATGYGRTGPYSQRPGQDLLVQSLSGLASITGSGDGPPVACGTPVADEHGARLLALGVVLALFHRERTGEGQLVESNLLNGLIDCQCQELATFLNGGREPERSPAGMAHAMTPAPYGIYATKDGFLALAQTPMTKLAEILEDPALSRYEGLRAAYEHRDEIKRRLDQVFVRRTTDEWLGVLGHHDVWCAPVHSYSDLTEDPQVLHNQILTTVNHPTAGEVRVTNIPISMSGSPGSIRRSPPLLGEHTEEVLEEWGLSSGEVGELRDQGVLG
jgi:crotonobetainyl-CoA:carnitine CoA-transferase CaiB-like acyl-CoA transferase